MKSTEYTVKFKNGKFIVIYAFNFKEAIIYGLKWALDNAYEDTIESISNEFGEKIINPVISWTKI